MQIKNKNEIEEIHRRMGLQMATSHADYKTKWKKIQGLIDKLGDALYPSKSKCPLCESLETRTSLNGYNRDSGKKTFIKECDTCGHSWLTVEIE